MVDALFAEPRLAAIYDYVDSDRSDLEAYLSMVTEFGAKSVLDIGCGTGVFACMLSERGIEITGVDPATASLAIARAKVHSSKVHWVEGDVSAVPDMRVDLITMTGNVAQVFLTDEEWSAVLVGARRALAPGGRLVFETRNPAAQVWKDWNRDASIRHFEVPGIGGVQAWVDLKEVNLPYVSFRWTYVFESGANTLISDSTLRFRTRQDVEETLKQHGLVVEETRDAPDRPGLEFVFIARLG